MKEEPKDSWKPGRQGTGDSQAFPGCALGLQRALISEEPSAHPCPQRLGPTMALGREGEVTGHKPLELRE